MAKYVIDETTLKAIADAIRENAPINLEGYSMTPEEMSAFIPDVRQEGHDAGYSEGKQAQYDGFWDAYQDNGNRKDYKHAFSGYGWTDATFKPKYDIKPTNTYHMLSESRIADFKGALQKAGVIFDMANATDETYFLQNNKALQNLPILDCRSKRNINYFIYSAKALVTIDEIKLKEDGTQAFNAYSFWDIPLLEEVRFSGCIGKSLEIKDSPLLSVASVQSIIDCLKDLTGATAQTLTLHATVGGKLTDAQKAAISAKNWTLVY